MKKDDDAELHRLSALLSEIGALPQITPPHKEALRKAGFALGLCLMAGQREKIELLYSDAPLTEQQKEKLRSYGIDLP